MVAGQAGTSRAEAAFPGAVTAALATHAATPMADTSTAGGRAARVLVATGAERGGDLTVEELLEGGLELAGARPVHLAIRGTAM